MAKLNLYLVEQQAPVTPQPYITEIVVASPSADTAKDAMVWVGKAFGLFAKNRKLKVTYLGPMEAVLDNSQVRWSHRTSQVLVVGEGDYSYAEDW